MTHAFNTVLAGTVVTDVLEAKQVFQKGFMEYGTLDPAKFTTRTSGITITPPIEQFIGGIILADNDSGTSIVLPNGSEITTYWSVRDVPLSVIRNVSTAQRFAFLGRIFRGSSTNHYSIDNGSGTTRFGTRDREEAWNQYGNVILTFFYDGDGTNDVWKVLF